MPGGYAGQWQAKDLRDTENERVRKLLKTKDEKRGDFCAKSGEREEKSRLQGTEFK
jgi:hypothetical protein